MTIENLITLTADPAGNLPLRAIHFIAKFPQEGNIVSIGARNGWADFALALNATVPVYVVDSYRKPTPSELALWNANAQELNVTDRLVRWDGKAWSGPIDLLYVDAASPDLDAALNDFLPSMAPDGYVAFAHIGSRFYATALQVAQEYFTLKLIESGADYQIFQFKGQIRELDKAKPAEKAAPVKLAEKVPAKKPVRRPAKKKVVKKPVAKAK